MTTQIPPNTIARRYYGSNLYIDEKATISDMRADCPLFFKNKHKGEQRKVYRGGIIVTHIFTASDQTRFRMWNVYMYDTRQKDMHSIDDKDVKSWADARACIDKYMTSAEYEPLNLVHTEIEVKVPAIVRVAAFYDKDGKLQGTDVQDWVHVGGPDTTQQKLPGDTFCTEVWSQVPKLVQKQVTL